MKHLTTHYSDSDKRYAEVHQLEDTYVVHLYEDGKQVLYVYYDLIDDAEDRAEEFVLAAK